jgi:hypothetical protein
VSRIRLSYDNMNVYHVVMGAEVTISREMKISYIRRIPSAGSPTLNPRAKFMQNNDAWDRQRRPYSGSKQHPQNVLRQTIHL